MYLNLVIAGLIVAAGAAAQTKLDLSAQSTRVDFSSALSTMPFASGNTLPGACNQGQVYNLVAPAPGAAVYLCSPAGQWSQLSLPPDSAVGDGQSLVFNAP